MLFWASMAHLAGILQIFTDQPWQRLHTPDTLFRWQLPGQ